MYIRDRLNNELFSMKVKLFRYVVLSVISFLVFSRAQGQQDPNFSLFSTNGIQFNPAFAGEVDGIRFVALNRNQWSGIKQAPISSTFSVNTPVNYNRIGLGVNVSHQSFRGDDQFAGHAIGSYKIRIARGILSFGLQLGVNKYTANFDGLAIQDLTDPVLNNPEYWTPNIGAGLLFTRTKYYLGLSVAHLAAINNSENSESGSVPHYYFTGGYKVAISSTLQLVMSNWTRWTTYTNLSTDFNLTLNLIDKAWIGVSGRNVEEVAFLAGLNLLGLVPSLNSDLRLAYAFSKGFGVSGNINGNTHEIGLTYIIKPRPKISALNSHQKILSPLFVR